MENKTFHDKLLLAQKKIGKMTKDKKGVHGAFYADINQILEIVKPILNEEGLVLTQALTHIDGKPAISTTISDGVEYDESITPLIELQDPQKMGAVITYMRRYALQSLLALQADDDDADSTITKTQEDRF